MAEVTRWLNASTASRDEEMFAALYAELHRIARGRMAAERPDQTLDDSLPVPAPLPDERLLQVHEVLDQLEQEHEMDAQIVKLRFFGGLKQDEIASLLEVSEKTVQRHWIMAKTWLYRALR